MPVEMQLCCKWLNAYAQDGGFDCGSSARKIAVTDNAIMIARTITLVMLIVLPHTRVQILDYMYGINYGVSLCEEANAPE